jgi:serine/threonine protein kinase
MVAIKQIGLDGLKEEEIAQLMREVDLVKRLSHPSIVKYEGMARDENTLSIVLECVPHSTFLSCASLPPIAAAHLCVILGTNICYVASSRADMPRMGRSGRLSRRLAS